MDNVMISYQLFFHQPVHFGEEGIGQEKIDQTVHSDTLWGALIQKWLLLFNDDPDTLCLNSGFTVSSCFPIIDGKRFYPLPVGSLDRFIDRVARGDAENEGVDIRQIKKIKYISESMLFDYLNGNAITNNNIELDVFPPLKSANDYEEPFAKAEQRPRVRTDQLNGGVDGDGFFYCTDQFFDEKSGLHFIALFSDDETKKKFDAALNLLADSGLGADRSVGRGCFSIQSVSVSIPEIINPEKYLLLSLYHPTKNEVQQGVMAKGKGAYTLVRRYGRAGSHRVSRFRRADCWMLAEGAVLPYYPKGQIPCVLKAGDGIPHNVYRNGSAFCLAAHEAGNGI